MKILVITEHDDGCGPMAAAFLSDYSSKVEVVSAGRHPVKALPLILVAVMRECLIDLADYIPRDVATLDLNDFDVVYECPDLPCPTEVKAIRELRDQIKNEAFLFYKKISSNPKGRDQ
jgi:protein-tyrosine-phosphatase